MRKKMISILLAFVMVFSTLPMTMLQTFAADDTSLGWASTGSIGVTLRFDRIQEYSTISARDIKATILQDGEELASIKLDGTTTGSYATTVGLRYSDGGVYQSGTGIPGYADFSIQGLALGSYTLRVEGDGYKTYEQEVLLDQYSKQIIIGTGDKTFTLGDVDNNDVVTEADWEAAASKVSAGSTTSAGTDANYDINGDGVVDIIDLAYISRMQNAQGEAEVLDTDLIPSADLIQMDYATAGIAPEQVQQLLQGTNEVKFPVNTTTSTAVIPIEFQAPVEMDQINITTPSTGTTQIQKGVATVETNDGEVFTIPFDTTAPEGVHAISARASNSVITIQLGNRVPVKKITITVEQNEDGGFIAVDSIEFLKDIVPETPVAANNQVKKVYATAGDASVKLSWTALSNVSSYLVRYKEVGSTGAYTETNVLAATATISGLTNGKTYTFTVTPSDVGLIGIESDAVQATPMTAEAPLKPSISSVKTADKVMTVAWTGVKDATYYQVYISTQANTGFTQVNGKLTSTSTTINNLTNGQTYYVYVKAGNAVGLSPQSVTATGKPESLVIAEPEGIPATGRVPVEKIQSVKLTDTNNWMSGELGLNGSINSIIDGNYATGWTAKTDSSNKELVVTFTEPLDIDQVIWVPRRDSQSINYGSYLSTYAIKAYSTKYPNGVYVAPSTLTDYAVSSSNYLQVQNDPATTGFAVLPFDAVGNIKKIAITVLPNKSANPVSLSELIIMERDPNAGLASEVTALFADALYTTLKPEVTKETLDALQTRVNSSEINSYINPDVIKAELKTAYKIFNSQNIGVVKTNMELRNIGDDSYLYKQSGSELIPLGLSAKANSKIVVYVDGLVGSETVEIYATQTLADVNAWIGQAGVLKNGRNIITVPKVSSLGTVFGGSLYLNNSTLILTNPEDVKVHVIEVVDNTLVQIPVLELERWYDMSEQDRRTAISAYVTEMTAYAATLSTSEQNSYLNVTEISMPSVLLSVPALTTWDRIRTSSDATEMLYQNVLAWEELSYLTNYTQGIETGDLASYDASTLTTRQNVRAMTMFGGAFMYAAGNHVGVGYSSAGALMSGKPSATLAEGATENSLFGWGIGHEFGHNLDKLGKLEVTNNLYALMAQTYDGDTNVLSSRLEPLYPSIFSRTAQATMGDAGSVFVQLGLYWQLHLAYDDAADPMGFYNRFFTAWKAGTYTAGLTSYDDKLAVTASAVAGKDLTEFFTRWGRQLSATAKTKMATYPTETRAIWYLSDQSRRDRLDGVAGASGSVSLNTSISNKDVTLSWTPSITGDVQGYEILRDGKVIDFVTDATTFVDTIALANHRNFTYTVKAYDRLGDEITTSNEESVRIAYDKTVDSNMYTIERDAETNAVRVTFTSETPISGIKIVGDNVPTSGTYTATVTTTQEGETSDVVAKNGDFSDNEAIDDASSFLAYFNKPGAVDTRIWTYDAEVLVLTDIPTSVDLSEIQILSYAGDDIAFYTDSEAGIAIGKLSETLYIEDDTIAAGTLVVVGTYRGDPVYNTIQMEGVFQTTSLDENGVQTVTEVTRPLDGTVYLYAEIPEDGKVSTISDGLFIFVPNVQKENELQGGDCNGELALPTKMKAVLYRTNTPNDASSKYLTAETSWIFSPNGDDLPKIVLEGNNG